MKKQLFNVLVIAFILSSFSTVSYALLASGKITIKVLSEDGNPVASARVGIGFDDVRSKSKENSVVGFTDDQGSFSGSETTTSGYLAFNVTKDGYYKTTGDYQFKDRKTFGWEPWNPELKVILRKIENPVSMYARQAKIEIPVAGQDVGFDLMEYDWVIPYGKGLTEDVTIHLDMDDKGGNDFEYNVKIKFLKQYNGFYAYAEEIEKGSSFKLQRLANIDGYNDNEINVLMVGLKRGSKLSWNDNKHYVFRVRSEVKNGKFIRGMYGKIVSDIKLLSARKTGGMPSLSFVYYLNPDYTPNLEFDPKRNLFGNLPDLERVTEP